MPGIGRECGKPSLSPGCNRRSKKPVSILAVALKGGVLISPLSQTSGFLQFGFHDGHMSNMTYSAGGDQGASFRCITLLHVSVCVT
jgi:hypothetical protein